MTNQERILAFLRQIAPADASNSEIVSRTGIRPHQQVFMITQELVRTGKIKGLQAGHEWRFWCGEGGDVQVADGNRDGNAKRTMEASPYGWDMATSVDLRMGMTWVPQGRIILDGGRIKVPSVPPVPGLYRFRIEGVAGKARYVGESENLARRFALYSNPGPSQQTNVRLNATFRAALSSGAEVGVAIVAEGAWIEVSGSRLPADLASQAVRRLLENAAIVERQGDAVESLNRST